MKRRCYTLYYYSAFMHEYGDHHAMAHTRGLTLGKFAPLHQGHQYLIETALAEVDELVVIIYDAPETTVIPLNVRAEWLRSLSPYFSAPRTLGGVLVLTLALAAGLGTLMTQIHTLLPTLFPQPAAFPYLDALTTIMSFSAMGLMAQKRLESWIYWIIVDVIGIGLYYVQGVRFIALLYVILLVLAISGLVRWLRARQPTPTPTPASA